jgi:starch synthase
MSAPSSSLSTKGLTESCDSSLSPIGNVCHVAMEMTPFWTRGGLARVTGELVPAMHKVGRPHGIQVSMILPAHLSDDANIPWIRLEETGFSVSVQIRCERVTFALRRLTSAEDVTIYFLYHPDYFKDLYNAPFEQQFKQATIFSAGAVEALRVLGDAGIRFAIVHVHEFQTSLIPLIIRTVRAHHFTDTASVFTIHRIDPWYQGRFPPEWFEDLVAVGVPRSAWQSWDLDGMEYYGAGNMLKAGIVYADAVTTVSRRYRDETLHALGGHGLDGLLSKYREKYHGIPHGIASSWNPNCGDGIHCRFTADDVSRGKALNKSALRCMFRQICEQTPQKSKDVFGYLNQFRSDRRNPPILAFAGRLTEGKAELLMQTAKSIIETLKIQLVVQGQGEKRIEEAFIAIAKNYPGWAVFRRIFEADLRPIYAGADFVVIPSLPSEPFGRIAVEGSSYGAIAILHAAGGLRDLGVDPVEDPLRIGTCYKFHAFDNLHAPDSLNFVCAVERAVMRYYDHPDELERMRQQAMLSVPGWHAIIREYFHLYHSVIERRSRVRH